MADIVDRLRKFFHPFTDEEGDPDEEANTIMNEAADEIGQLNDHIRKLDMLVAGKMDEIERLRRLDRQSVDEIKLLTKKNAELLAALERVIDGRAGDRDIARAAIEKAKT